MMRKTFWNSGRGRIERSLRASLKAGLLLPADEAVIDAAIALAKSVDHLLKQAEQQMTLAGAEAHEAFGDTKFAYHLRLGVSSYIQTLEALLLTPQTRAQYLAEHEEIVSPFATELADVRKIMS